MKRRVVQLCQSLSIICNIKKKILKPSEFFCPYLHQKKSLKKTKQEINDHIITYFPLGTQSSMEFTTRLFGTISLFQEKVNNFEQIKLCYQKQIVTWWYLTLKTFNACIFHWNVMHVTHNFIPSLYHLKNLM